MINLINSFTLLQYQEAGCPIVLNPTVKLCNSNVECDLSFRKGGCEAYKKLLAIKPLSDNTVVHTNSVKAEAKRLGLSLSEVRRRRRESH
jgi:hypothetical protein